MSKRVSVSPFADQSEQRKSRKKPLILLFLVFSLAIVLMVGSILAFFSDVIFVDKSVTSGTLRIGGEYTYTVNGQAQAGDIAYFAPGDVVVVTATVSNQGNMSAWVREIFSFQSENAGFDQYLSVYLGEFTFTQLSGGAGDAFNLTLTEGEAASSARVLDGFGEGAEQPTGGGFTYVGSHTYTTKYTILFAPEAGNDLQNSSFGFRVTTQALQFANNNEGIPSNEAWGTVVPAEIVD